ncbi:hypothetical protein BBP40_010999 [Aspergillus hancockii]|nr:hypothetical protein BBP40_010999 [Aspergillus hancockii]
MVRSNRGRGLQAIVGAGPIGLAVLVLLKELFGPSQIDIIGRGQSRPDVAKILGADATLSDLELEPGVIQSRKALTGGQGFDTVVEAVGSKEAFEVSQVLVASGSTIATLGIMVTNVICILSTCGIAISR